MISDIWKRFETNAARYPDKAAFIYFHKGIWETVTYAQLLDLTNRIAHGLLACRITSGMTAALMTLPSVEFFALTFALLKLGIVPIIVDPAIGLKKVKASFKESKPDIFIGNTLTHTLRKLFGWGKESIKHNLSINQLLRITNYELQTTDHWLLNTDSPAAIIYTSGSTGSPKGVLYNHGNFSAQLDLFQATFNISPDEIDLPAFPLYAIIDVLLGVTSVIPDINFPVPGKTNPEKVIHAIQQFNVTNMFASPVVLDILAKYYEQQWSSSFERERETYRDHHLPSLKRVITAGAPASTQLQNRFRNVLGDETSLFGIYGATEALPIAKIESHEIFDIANKTAQGAGICLGKPVDGATVRIIEITDSAIEAWQDSLEVQPNVIGEITVQGAAVTRVYFHREDANRLAKIKMGDDVIHRMGDVGYFDEQGHLWYCGRKSHRVQTNDIVMFTEQIEGIFNEHAEIYRTALVGVNKEPVLWVEPRAKLRKSFGKIPVLTAPWQTSEVFVIQDKIKQELMELAKNHPQASKIRTFLFMKKFPTDVRHNSKIIREQLTLLAEKSIL
ncbi:MAG: AMP-binding protein [Anaerolineales bacterium]|nr:AMP-binding protein [Anaerolineales bacterium]